MRRRPKINKEDIAESWCFNCKDGGLMRVCDFKDCLKVYHPQCVGKDEGFCSGKDSWSCGWHFCFLCGKRPKFQCFCCPKAVCGRCLYDAQFVVIKGFNGFCLTCAILAGLLEGVKIPDPEEDKVDFNDRDTHEFFFKPYWEMTKKKFNLNSQHVRLALKLFSKDICQNEDLYCNGIDEMRNSLSSSENNDKHLHSSESEQATDVQRKNKRKYRRQKNSRPMKKDFVGWGSQPLMGFLAAIGVDTSQELSQLDVNDIILRYCTQYSLFHPEKKKNVICDSSLHSLFGKKSVNKNRIFNLLSAHFANNGQEEDSGNNEYNNTLWPGGDNIMDESNNGCNSKDRRKSVVAGCKRQGENLPERTPEPSPSVAVSKMARSSFALITSQNIRLVYMKRSLVKELLAKPETFDEKVIGSFIRIKSDPNDYMQRASHQLQLVTDVKRSQVNGCTSTGVYLQVSNRHQDIAISQLSEDNFSEEECEDLDKRMKDGLLRRLAAVELEKKAKVLHEDITKHWITTELAQLRILINQANEKGWRKELSEYLDRMSLLQTPQEQSRLLQKVPEVITKDEGELVHEYASKIAEAENVVTLEATPPRQRHIVSGLKSSCSTEPIFRLVRSDRNCNGQNRTDSLTGEDGEIFKGKMQQTETLTLQDPRQLVNAHESRDDTAFQGESEEPNQEKSKSFCKTSDEKTPASVGLKSSNLHEQSVTADRSRNDIACGAQSPESNHKAIESSPKRSTTEEKEQSKATTGSPPEQPAIAVEMNDDIDGAADYESNQEPLQCHPETSREVKFTKQIAIPDLIILSDDEDSDASIARSRKKLENIDNSQWYFMGPFGIKGGPYSIAVLKEWSDTMTLAVEFKVWRANQSQEEALHLTDAIRQYYRGG